MTVDRSYDSSLCRETYITLKESQSRRPKFPMESSVSGSGHLQPGLFVSPPSRSGSFKCPSEGSRSRQNVTSDFHRVTDDNTRRESFPPNNQSSFLSISYDDIRKDDENTKASSIRRVRSFKTTSKGVVNRGDSFRKRGGRVTGSSRDNSNNETLQTDPYLIPRCPKIITQLSSGSEPGTTGSYFKVVMIGAPGVGRTSIAQQFQTSEYIAFDSSMDQDEENSTVSVLLNGEESTLEFIDGVDEEVDLEDVKADAYLVVFSIAHRDTFDTAIDLLNELRHGIGTDRATILVGNKSDLVRKRKVKTEEALSVAQQYDAKYTETSAALNHHVDELLVGMLSQIRFKLNPSLPEPVLHVPKKSGSGISRKSFKGTFDFLSRIFRRGSSKKGSSRKGRSTTRDLR